jgi:hypothetical protein
MFTWVVEKEGMPRFYLRTLVELEDFVIECWEDREGRKAMSKNNSKGLTNLRQKLKKYLRNFEAEVKGYRENPDLEDEKSDGSDDDQSDSDSDDSTDIPFLKKEPTTVKKPKFLEGVGTMFFMIRKGTPLVQVLADKSVVNSARGCRALDHFSTRGVCHFQCARCI